MMSSWTSGGVWKTLSRRQVEHRVASAGMGVIVVMPLRVGRVEGVEGQQRPEPLAAFAGDQGLTRDLAGYGQARAFDGVVGVERMKRSTASAMRDSIRAKSDETVIPRGYPQGFTNTRTADWQA